MIDGDDIAGWETTSGVPVTQPVAASDDWLLSHRWVWPRSRVEEIITERSSVDRLNAPSNAHRTVALRAQILDGRPVFEAQMRAAGAIELDGRLPIPTLAARILNDVASR